ncbi:monooxygenase [Agrobacterium tumefaciens str. B6]|uniref:NtaA/DmoA family FMN-dependent monooxygenase n=1 Tax=Agrobacterium tumefaciens TaxID=358 RepID=UPI000760FFE6|nr:NtaA/DmoA family FMN-dependent monooxygenase [Agrobacterium tumefaciens]KWT85498.1 monooxygenase [Agrobacterium tumefaciens str. B6]
MSVATKLHVGMSLAPTWLSGEAWRRADSGINGVFSSDYFVDLAQRAEAAHVDFVFRPDTLFLRTEGLEAGGGFASMDPTMLLAAIARETSHVGLLSTVSTTFLPPYVVARQIQSLNWLSSGRAGWNIVTALDGHENFGLREMPSPQERYERAAEFTQVVQQLWASFPNEALKLDRESGRFADSSLVHPVAHEGRHFSVKGPLNLPAHASRIPLVQAGASPEGRDFASSVADAVFASTPDMQAAIELRADLRRRAEGHGRNPDGVKLMPGLSLYLADSGKEALELFAETHARANRGRAFASIRDMTGLDLSDWPLQRIVSASDLPPPETPRSRTHANLLRRLIERETLSVADLLRRPEVMGSGHWQIIGTVDDALETIREWAAAGAIDGFVAVPGGSVASMRLVLERLLPELADAGLFRTAYSGCTFAEHLAE